MGLFNFNKKSKKRSEWPPSNGLTETQKRNIDLWSDKIHKQAMAEGRDEVEIFGEQLERLGIVKRRPESYIRKWVDGRVKEIENVNTVSPEFLFVGVMSFVIQFAKQKQSASGTTGLDQSVSFSGDSSLFELTCYAYFRIDMWLFANEPGIRVKVANSFIRQLLYHFSRALNSNHLQPIFADRASKYGELAREGENLEQFHFYLSHLIAKTKDNTSPKSYDGEFPQLNLDFMSDSYIKMELLNWEKYMLPALLDGVRDYTVLIK